MVWVTLIILGIVQGLTEFLPISSSGHLVLLYDWFGIQDNTILLSVLLHIATLLSVLIVYRKIIWKLIRHPFCHTNWCLLVATIPTVILALLFKNMINYAFGGTFLWLGFLLTAFLLSISSLLTKKNIYVPTYPVTDMPLSLVDSFAMGVGQGIACFPGVSRSGTTIATGLILGVDQKVAMDFSFLMSIPVIIGSLLLELLENKFTIYWSYSFGQIAVAFVICFVVGMLAIKLLGKVVAKKKLTWFARYLYLLSALLIGVGLYRIFFV